MFPKYSNFHYVPSEYTIEGYSMFPRVFSRVATAYNDINKTQIGPKSSLLDLILSNKENIVENINMLPPREK